jgi:hypothetical protein
MSMDTKWEPGLHPNLARERLCLPSVSQQCFRKKTNAECLNTTHSLITYHPKYPDFD